MADFSEISANRFQDDLRRAAGFKPLIQEDLKKAYKRYESAGVKMGRVGNKSDKALYKMATDDVLRWYKKNKAKAATTAASPARPSAATPSAITRSQAATIIRQMGLNPAEVIGWGTNKPFNSWITSQNAAYVWKSPTSFQSWLQRAYGK